MRVDHYASGAMETVDKQEMVEAFLEPRLNAMCRAVTGEWLEVGDAAEGVE